ncbi:MAG TPA: tail fiber protein [Myxococcota bacterium]|nr:tail fiber protein [Myxococcota bacterium]
MAEPFIGEIRIFGGNFAPKGYATCDGQILAIAQNQALFSILGTTYGGNGQTTFALPDLRGRVPQHFSSATPLGQRAGVESVTLTTAQIPAHDHGISASAEAAGSTSPAANVLAKKPRFGADVYAAPASLIALSPASIANTGGGQPHINLQPYLVLTFVIALVGVFPSRN